MADPIDFGKTLRAQAALGRAVAKQQQEKSHTLVCAKDVIIRDKDWIWEHHLLRGALELMTGMPGVGKSQVQLHYIACLTKGLKWPDGAAAPPLANVILLTAEDCLDQDVVPRLIAADANRDRVFILKNIKQDDKGRQFLLGEDLDELENVIKKVGDVGLIAVDPITAYMGSKIDSHKTTEVRSQLGPLKDFSERTNIGTSAITHPAKGANNNTQKAIDHFIGSQAFIAAARLGHLCIEEVDTEGSKTGRVLFTHVKWNPTVKQPTLSYRIIGGVDVGYDEAKRSRILSSRVAWETGTVNISADEAVVAANKKPESEKAKAQTAQAKCQEFLAELLKDGTKRPQKDIAQQASRLGFTEGQLRTARVKIGVVVTHTGFGESQVWWWELIPFNEPVQPAPPDDQGGGDDLPY
jgi:putative DNA primase/helicase